jgi:hypothetical protein
VVPTQPGQWLVTSCVYKLEAATLNFPYRASSISYNKCFQQTRLVLYLHFIYILSPYMFRAFLGPSSGYLKLLLCYHLVHAMFVDRPCALRTGLWRWLCCEYSKATSTNQFAGHTGGQQTLHEPNGSITTAWDTPDDGPKKARNM